MKMIKEKELKTKIEIEEELNQFIGSEEFYKDYLNCVMTQGFKFLCDRCASYWLFSDVASFLMLNEKIKNNERFILVKISVHKDKSCNVMLFRDYNKEDEDFNRRNLLHIQHYEYTDFPLNDFEFYCCLNEIGTYTFMLKGEY